VLNDNTELSINQLPEQATSIPVKVLTGTSGFHVINVQNIEEYNALNCLLLEDLFSGITYDLFNQQTVSIFINDTTTVARFLLHIGTSSNIISSNPTCSDSDNGVIIYENNSSLGYETNWMDSEGNVILQNSNSFASDSLTNLSAGVYTIEIIDPICGSNIETISLTSPDAIVSNFTLSNNALDYTFNNTSVNGASYLWDFGDGNTSTETNPTHTYDNEGSYLVSLTVYQNGNCFSEHTEWVNILTTGIETFNEEETNVWIKDHSLSINSNSSNFHTYLVKNSLGQVLAQDGFNSNTKVNLSKISSQVLFVTLLSDTDSQTIKVIYTNQ